METNVWIMILRMSVAVLIYVLITAGLWLVCRKREMTAGLKLLAGLVYGASCVAANHIGIDYGSLILNVRDIGPLTAGLFFSPAAGIIAGVIGGVERMIAGEVWGIGRFTEVACSLSTCLAGILAAILNRKVYAERRPSITHAFLIGAVMEVFHMYAVLFTNREEIQMAYYVVEVAAIPMILFTAIGVALCALVSKKMNGEKVQFRVPQEKQPIDMQFQRWLLVVTVILFLFNFILDYTFQTRLVTETAISDIKYVSGENASVYHESGSMNILLRHLEEQHSTDHFFLVTEIGSGKVLVREGAEENPEEAWKLGIVLTEKDQEAVLEHLDGEPFTFDMESFSNLNVMCYAVRLNEETALLTLRTTSGIYEGRDAKMYESTLSDILLFTVLYVLIAMLVDYLVVRSLDRVNVSLNKITNGKLDEEVWVRSSSEFSELSDDINKTVTALKGYIGAAEKKMEEELKFAAQIQDAALPRNFNLPTESIKIYALMTPAKQVGGDFYDFFSIDNHQLALVIADVSGKGVPAALFMMRAKTAIKNFARSGQGPAELLQNVNNALCEGNDAEMFVTVWLGILNLKTGLMRCANAGHEYPAIRRADGDYELLKDKHGMILAEFENIKMKEYEVQLEAGDQVFVYTDGVPEAVNEKLEQYGTDRMIEKLNKLKILYPQQILESMLRDIRNFAGAAEQFDDITMLGFTYNGNKETIG